MSVYDLNLISYYTNRCHAIGDAGDLVVVPWTARVIVVGRFLLHE